MRRCGWSATPTAPHIDRIERAVEKREVLTLDYRDEAGRPSARDVRPLGLWFWGKVWTLVAWCEMRADFRAFRIDRIASVMVTGRIFKPERGKQLADFYRSMERGERARRHPRPRQRLLTGLRTDFTTRPRNQPCFGGMNRDQDRRLRSGLAGDLFAAERDELASLLGDLVERDPSHRQHVRSRPRRQAEDRHRRGAARSDMRS